MAADLTTAINALVECVCSGLEDAGRPVCECGLTVGPPMVAMCCECETGETSGQVVGFLERLYPADGLTLEQTGRFENCRPGPVAADISIVVTRCYPTIDEGMNVPALEDTTEAAENLNTDMGAAWNALVCCGQKILIRESAVDADPEGGCSAFAIRVSVLVNPNSTPVVIGS